MMAHFQIKLTPVEYFFFGGEKHTLNEDNELVTNYFVESGHYPQQTTILGLIRYMLLLKNSSIFKNNKIIKGSNVADFIGKRSFDYTVPSENYGKIKGISSLYFIRDDISFYFGPLDFGCDLNDEFLLSKDIDMFVAKMQNKSEEEKWITQNLVSNDGERIVLGNVVKDICQVGNEKGENGVPKKSAFYKQNMKRLEKDWSFAVDVEIEDDAGLENTDKLFIPFGGEKCLFKLEVLKKDRFCPQINQARYKRDVNTLICISDVFLEDPSLLKFSDFAITESVSFRNLLSNSVDHGNNKSTESYNSLSQKNDAKIRRGERLNLLKRGSVLYFKEASNLMKFEESIQRPYLTQIGFNNIITINK